MLEAATSGLTTAIGWVGTVVTSLLDQGELAALLPLVGINMGISAFMLGLKGIKSFSWGF